MGGPRCGHGRSPCGVTERYRTPRPDRMVNYAEETPPGTAGNRMSRRCPITACYVGTGGAALLTAGSHERRRALAGRKPVRAARRSPGVEGRRSGARSRGDPVLVSW